MRLGEATWNEVDAAARRMADDDGTRSPIILIPIGSTEQHGPHLPLNTDTLVAEEIAGRALHRTTGLMLGPTISITASGEHAGFAGTLSIGTEAMAQVAIELGRSAEWAAGIVFVNGHGGNHEALARAVDLLTAESRCVLSWWPKWRRRTDGGPPDLHAGRIETSLMLAIDPGLVRFELATDGPGLLLSELLPRLRADGVRSVSPSGVLGDPDGASGAEGERFISDFVDDLVLTIEQWRPIDPTPHESTRLDTEADPNIASPVDASPMVHD
ncbi:MAG: mycofactocin biosynthesis peptidyl-dipeptidase MftE [Ilumatobacter sp.]|nr:mycofactocin biosynthesis peptidyl-dipeptidase MftE [bacterium]MDG1265464.1 mycofactocin biosynthesis peptidyl-dipeptidase MftE [Ilumatobacter sp.]MDG2040199.1 mycofactocin biosynthesis peptidyl-dipeptidase MftE [Ilumatobacter sp.]NKB39580.1 mycofactocin biosynthesis peptidyl-dipeptidase MftE [Ilumatobacter sp.]